MLKIAKEPTFTHEVKAQVPVDGGYKPESFKVTFRVIDVHELEKLDQRTAEGGTALLRRIVARIDDIADAEGNPLEWNDETFAAVLALPWARQAMWQHYNSALSGARQGN